MTKEQILDRLTNEVIHNGARHPFYRYVCDLADKYRRYTTGIGMEKDLEQFAMREDAEAFAQRVRITKHVVPAAINSVSKVKYKIPRANYRRILTYDPPNDTKQAEIETVLSKFWGTASLDNYFSTRWLEIDDTDPNAFIVVEFTEFDNVEQRAEPYPFEVESHKAVDYAHENNVLQYLVCLLKFPMPVKGDDKHEGEKYTVYLQNETVVFTELNPEISAGLIVGDSDKAPYFEQRDGVNYFVSRKRVFQIDTPTPHNIGAVPAFQAGYTRDLATNGYTYTAFYHPGLPYLEKLIKTTSELDLTMCLSAFPFRAEYAPPCDAEGCLHGYLSDGSGPCHTCKGTGHKSVTSAQEKIVLTMPRESADMVDLDKLIIFKSPDTGILEFQKNYIREMLAAFKEAVFNSDVFSKAEVSDTATGKNLEYQNVYDTLYPTAQAFASKWQFAVETCAKITGLDAGLIAQLIFSKDFKLKGMEALLLDLETAKRSQAGPSVIRAIQEDIQRLIYADNPTEFNRWQVKESFNPFSGKSADEIAMALTDSTIPAKYKVLYNMFGVIFDEIAQTNPDFYELERTRQQVLIDEKIREYQGQATPAAAAFSLVNGN